MRERRWESAAGMEFDQVLAVGERLASLGLKAVRPANDVICYVEEWTVERPEDLDRLDPWLTEDVTLVHLREGWRGDFFLLAGAYHTIYQRYQSLGTYCSVSHPWLIPVPLQTHESKSMLWLGFRHTHGFIRVRLHTKEVVTPGEKRAEDRRALWVEERRRAFQSAIDLLELPIEAILTQGSLVLQTKETSVPFFCSWPDAFGPCQFEFLSTDAFEFLVPASRLAATIGDEPAVVRAYLTGFAEAVLEEFQTVEPKPQIGYRCSAHCPLDDLPEVLRAIAPAGRLYATLCEFQTRDLRPDGEDASAIVGVMGLQGAFKMEVRLNRAPLPEDAMPEWIESLVGHPMRYVPLPPFP